MGRPLGLGVSMKRHHPRCHRSRRHPSHRVPLPARAAPAHAGPSPQPSALPLPPLPLRQRPPQRLLPCSLHRVQPWRRASCLLLLLHRRRPAPATARSPSKPALQRGVRRLRLRRRAWIGRTNDGRSSISLQATSRSRQSRRRTAFASRSRRHHGRPSPRIMRREAAQTAWAQTADTRAVRRVLQVAQAAAGYSRQT